jgi:Zn finger protein HypA/HybF involved in hydrogenase expression
MENKNNTQVEVVQTSVTTEPVDGAVENAVVAEEVKKYVVNCYRCGAALNVTAGNMVYMCPVCNNLFRLRKGEKLVKDVSRTVVAEAYVNVDKGANE